MLIAGWKSSWVTEGVTEAETGVVEEHVVIGVSGDNWVLSVLGEGIPGSDPMSDSVTASEFAHLISISGRVFNLLISTSLVSPM